MSLEAWFTLAVTASVLVALVWNVAPPDVIFVGAAAVLALAGVITPAESLEGFSNPGMLTVAALFVVAAGLRETGALDYLGQRVLGTVRTEKAILRRLAAMVLPMSALLNNTPIVAMLMPMVIEWCRRNRISPSRLLIPLSFLTILGGTCTLIGTSTNLVVHGLMVRTYEETRPSADAPAKEIRFHEELRGLGLFELSLVGVPYAAIGFAYLYWFGRRVLPDRKELLEQLGESRREYLVEMQVEPGCRLIGQSVEDAGLRHLPGLFLIEIDRRGQIITPVSPEETLQAGDQLVFTGVVSSIVELERIPGLTPAADPDYAASPRRQRNRQLCEAVVSESSPLIGKTVREAEFRATYNAAVLAVHRHGSRVTNKIGDIELRPGDTLLLQTRPHFTRAYRNNPDFYLVSDVEDWRPLRRDRAGFALAALTMLIVLMTTGWVEITIAAFLAASAMIGTGCLSSGDARRSIDWQVLITIAASFAVGTALERSGAAQTITQGIVGWIRPLGPLAALAVFYWVASGLTEVITNNAAAVLLFPFCVETAKQFDASPRPFLIALVLAASASFMTPIGYQTNMMVYGPGGYRFSDFIRIGSPLNTILWLVAVVLVPIFWPF